MNIHNFSAGASKLSSYVIDNLNKSLYDYDSTGMSIFEIYHRDKRISELMDIFISLVKELLNVPNSHKVLIIPGGASLQFSLIPYNFIKDGYICSYIDSGKWAYNAISEARLVNNDAVRVIASSRSDFYKYIPKNYNILDKSIYLHITSNNTVYGTQLHEFPEVDVPIICDMTSDIFMRNINFDKFGFIYASSQKNIGLSGFSLCIIREDMLDNLNNLPKYLSYKTHFEYNSKFNTWPVFLIYSAILNLLWIKNQGGVDEMYIRSLKRSFLLYKEIDRNPFFKRYSEVLDCSNVNVVFNLLENKLELYFDNLLKKFNIIGLKGHRDLGGYRASMYNNMDIESVEKLVYVMRLFEQKYG